MGTACDWVLHLQQEGTYDPLSGLSECCENVKFETDPAIIFSAHSFHSHHFSLLVVSDCLLHGVYTRNSCRGILREYHSPSDNFVPLICLYTLYKVLDEVSTFFKPKFSVGMGSGTVPTSRKNSSAYHSGDVPWICGRVYRVMDTMIPHLLISSISNFLMLENQFINSEKLFLLPSLKSLKLLCSLIYDPILS